MRCKEVREWIVDGNLSAPAQAHLATCAECQSFARDAGVLNTAFEFLAEDAIPEPSWGFAGRVLARLNESPARLFDPLEVIGRRAVYAAGLLAMTIVMVLALSKSGPVRGTQGTFSLKGSESSYTAEVLLAGGVDVSEEANVLPVNLNGGDLR